MSSHNNTHNNINKTYFVRQTALFSNKTCKLQVLLEINVLISHFVSNNAK